jgi:UDP-glucose 4-epimerase
MTILIGGAGFLGSSIIIPLLKSDREVMIIGRKERPKEIDPRIIYTKCDGDNIKELADILKDAREIIDFSYTTTPQTSFEDPLSDLESNLPRAVRLFEACKQLKKLERLVIISSGGTVYGKVSKYPITELFPTLPVSPYGITKLTIEKYAYLYKVLYNLPTIVLRPANIYGERSRQNRTQGFINISMEQALRAETIHVYGKVGTIRDYVYISDFNSAIKMILDAGVVGATYNIGTGIGTNNIELLHKISLLARKHNLKITYKTLPERFFDVPSNILDSSRLTNDTGWHAKVSLDEGLEYTWNWLVRQKA